MLTKVNNTLKKSIKFVIANGLYFNLNFILSHIDKIKKINKKLFELDTNLSLFNLVPVNKIPFVLNFDFFLDFTFYFLLNYTELKETYY
ncbi:hypothetical protein BpHYR1_003349 [Brachionus plicatilis]|uniref:Uncharacterized protein n=1 Tax=Brachionus plicatilis TaxID=10195 RepID=A0A3M7PNA8_BRAPC|nr:hypothetical protein BpHYR1_003349 [Brachionus plicatilis]